MRLVQTIRLLPGREGNRCRGQATGGILGLSLVELLADHRRWTREGLTSQLYATMPRGILTADQEKVNGS